MAPRTLPPRDLVQQLLRYDPVTGTLIWRPREGAKNWNSRHAGKPAGSLSPNGHMYTSIGNGTHYRLHRLIWLLVYGEPVPAVIDHKDLDRSNNRVSNLRAASYSQNQANTRKRRHNTTGHKGVYRKRGKFFARINANGVMVHLGTFDALEEAAAARREATDRLHGEFARHE